MEPQQARLTFVAVLALSLVIVFNALYMQKDPGLRARALLGSQLQQAGAGADFSSLTSVQLEKRDELLRAIRRELLQRNYFPGNPASRLDGRVDAMTMGAIMAYQHDHALLVTGRVSQSLLKGFLFGVARPVGGQAKIASYGLNTQQLVAEVQGILSAKGHYEGPIDGIFKSRTSEAVKRFEADRGLPVTGRISGLLVQELARSTGVGFTASQK